MKYQLIIFDFDGTLCETRIAVSDSIKMAYERLGQTIPTAEKLEETMSKGTDTQEIFRLLSPTADSNLLNQLRKEYQLIYLSQAAAKSYLFTGAYELLSQLKAANILTAIVSNKSPDALQNAVEEFKLTEYIAKLVGVAPGDFCKPDPRIYSTHLAPVFPNINPHQIMMVGDSPPDLEFAKAIGADACWASYGQGDPTSCKALKPEYTLKQISDLGAIVFK